MIQLSLEPVIRFLSEPGKSVFAGLGHGYSSDGCGVRGYMVRWASRPLG
jgi:hypothetical protein